jgi:hypothetical protein
VRARARHFQSALGRELPAHLTEVNIVAALGREQIRRVHTYRRRRRGALCLSAAAQAERIEQLDRAAQTCDCIHVHALDDRRLFRVLFRQEQAHDAFITCADSDGERAAHGTHTSVEREFADR